MLESLYILEEYVSCLCAGFTTGEGLATNVGDLPHSSVEESLDLYELAVMRIILGADPPVTVTILSLLLVVQLVDSNFACLFTYQQKTTIMYTVYNPTHIIVRL